MMEKEVNNFYNLIFSLHGDKLLFHVNELIELYDKFNKSLKLKNDKTKNI